MNNNELKLDPQTGQTIQANPGPQPTVQPQPAVNPEPQPTVQPQPAVNPEPQPAVQPQAVVNPEPTPVVAQPEPTVEVQPEVNLEPQMVTAPSLTQVNEVPTIEQSENDFINNAQAVSSEQQEEKSGGLNYSFVIILFIAVLAAVVFLFPILSKYL